MRIHFKHHRLTVLFYTIVSCIGIAIVFYPTILSGFARLQSELSDTRINHYFLEHSFRTFFDRSYVGSLWTPAFFYPFQNTFALADNLLGSAPIYWVLRGFLADDQAYQVWMIIVVWLCFATYTFMLRHFRISHTLAAFGGFLFAFGLPRMAQISHQQLLPQFFTPIAFLFIWQFIQKPTVKKLAWAMGLIYLQILAGVYLGWFLVFSLLIFLPIIIWLDRSIQPRILEYFKLNWKPTIALFLTWGIGILWLFRPYLDMSQIIGKKPYSEIQSALPQLASWFLPAANSLWSGLLSHFANVPTVISQNYPFSEHYIFLGFTILGLSAIAVYGMVSRPKFLPPERALLIKASLLTALILFVLSLSVFDQSLWLLIFKAFPGANSIRVVTRIAFILYFYLLLGVLLYIDAWLKSRISKPRIRTAIAIFLLLLTLPEQIVWSAPSYDRAPIRKTEAEFQELMSKGCNFAYVEQNLQEPFYNQQPQAMWAGIRANVPVINGYSGADPPGLPMRQNIPLSELLEWLHKASSGTVQGRLCLIQPKRSQNQPDRDLPISAIAKSQQFQTANFTSFVIPVSPNTPLSQFSQSIRAITKLPETFNVNSAIDLPILVRNTGNFTWFRSGNTPVTLSYRWLNRQQIPESFSSERTLLPFNLPPKKAAALNAKITTPTRPGQYTLQLTMLQESVAWFADKGAKPLNLPITIVDLSTKKP